MTARSFRICARQKAYPCRALVGTILVCVTALLSQPGFAEEIIGSTILKGKRVELLGDGTWRYATAPETDAKCVPVNASVGFCGSILNWRPGRTAGSDFDAVFSNGDRFSAGIIHENIGSKDGMSPEGLRQIILENAADVSGTSVENIPVLEVKDATVDGHIAETMVYGLRYKGLNFVYQNTFMITQNDTAQFVSWAVTKDLLPRYVDLHTAFIDNIRLTLVETEEQL